ncbi:MAG: MotA/TolQ/ExbB proton channel family protein [Candidatus Latescibacterota bacterium]
MSGIELLSSVLFWAVCAMAGALILMQRMEVICSYEKQYGLPSEYGNLIGAVAGGLAGAGVAGIIIYYYLFAPGGAGWVEWIGRMSYVLILAATMTHVMLLVHVWLRLDREDQALMENNKKNQKNTLTMLRVQHVDMLRQSRDGYADLKARDDEALDDLMVVLGDRLFAGQRALTRIPFYGYLGTVCGILLMAEGLTNLDEATETFKVLRDMAGGLVLAFQTTLVALLTYLPLRKTFDVLLGRMADLERKWLAMRESALDGRQG